MLRLLWACLRWDDMAVKPSASVGTTRKGKKKLYIFTCADFSILNQSLFFFFKACNAFKGINDYMTIKSCHFKVI